MNFSDFLPNCASDAPLRAVYGRFTSRWKMISWKSATPLHWSELRREMRCSLTMQAFGSYEYLSNQTTYARDVP